jgi:hypothetical protein
MAALSITDRTCQLLSLLNSYDTFSASVRDAVWPSGPATETEFDGP